ncbi:MAG TPA: hypothetical protein VN030_05805 [Cellvibrio sp.]|nr:hypothetical protein [Cellvibrio sp.]
MVGICDADLAFLQPGKKVLLKSFQGSVSAPADILPSRNYWQLIGRKATVVKVDIERDGGQQVLVAFADDIKSLRLTAESNSLWVLLTDLKFVCRY